MVWVNIIAVLILVLSFFGGLREGAVKQFFNLAILIIAIPLAGISYRLIAAILSFLPGENWADITRHKPSKPVIIEHMPREQVRLIKTHIGRPRKQVRTSKRPRHYKIPPMLKGIRLK